MHTARTTDLLRERMHQSNRKVSVEGPIKRGFIQSLALLCNNSAEK